MRVRIAHADKEGCGFYRLIAPAVALKAQGLDVALDYKGESTRGIIVDNVVKSMDPLDCDVFVIQRPMTTEAVSSIPIIQSQGVAVVIELDDDYWGLNPGSEGYRRLHPELSEHMNHANLTKSLKLADLVTVSTPALAKLIPNKNVRVIRNCVPAYYTELPLPENKPDGLVVGWTGTPETHLGDLQRLGNSISRVVRATGSRFMCIGSEQTQLVLGLEDGETLFSPWVKFTAYAPAVKAFDAGVVPLRLYRFNQCKSYLKGLEYAAVGVPFVASPTDEYTYMNSKGCGILAHQKHDWYKPLVRLLKDEEYHLEQRMSNLDFVYENTYERNAWRWEEAWDEAMEIRRGVVHL